MALETQNFDLSALALFSLAFRSSARRMLASNDFRRATAPFLVSKYRLDKAGGSWNKKPVF